MKISELRDILTPSEICAFIGPPDREINALVYDSRQAKPGTLFMAIKGEKMDGHDFILDALQRGCQAVILERKIDLPPHISQVVVADTRQALARLSHHFFNQPSKRLKIIGITGTNGKTTTAYLVRGILEAAGYRVGHLGTIVYSIGEREIPAPITTPESLDLAHYLAEMVALGITHCVMEVSSHALLQKRVFGTHFTAGVFTNLGRDHLDYHKDMKGYREAKGILFRQLTADAHAILNQDDPTSAYFARITPAQIIQYGLTTEASLTAQINQHSLKGTDLTIQTPRQSIKVFSPLIGRHNVSNILAATATALALGITDPELISRGIASLRVVRGRLEEVQTNHPFKVLIDFAHTPDALKAVLSTLKELVQGRIILVFGCGGDRDKGKRPLMGQIAQEYAHLIVLTSDNPRSEEPTQIIKEIQKGITSQNKYYIEPDRRQAIKQALELARPDDLVLIAGKGHETSQIFRDTMIPFDDRAVVKEILGLRNCSDTLRRKVDGVSG